MAVVWQSADRKVSHLPGVVAAVREEADGIASRAEALLAEHRRTGASHIEVAHGVTDTWVELVDPEDAVAIEFGRAGFRRKDGTEVGPAEGLYIITRASGVRG